jgi:hypothetical protein
LIRSGLSVAMPIRFDADWAGAVERVPLEQGADLLGGEADEALGVIEVGLLG